MKLNIEKDFDLRFYEISNQKMFPSGNNIKVNYLDLLPSGNIIYWHNLIIKVIRFLLGTFSHDASTMI